MPREGPKSATNLLERAHQCAPVRRREVRKHSLALRGFSSYLFSQKLLTADQHHSTYRILWVVQSIDLWLVSQPHFEGAMKYSDRHLAGLSAGPPDRVELIGAGSLGYGTGPSFG